LVRSIFKILPKPPPPKNPGLAQYIPVTAKA
jgi:hypothetical protein